MVPQEATSTKETMRPPYKLHTPGPQMATGRDIKEREAKLRGRASELNHEKAKTGGLKVREARRLDAEFKAAVQMRKGICADLLEFIAMAGFEAAEGLAVDLATLPDRVAEAAAQELTGNSTPTDEEFREALGVAIDDVGFEVGNDQ